MNNGRRSLKPLPVACVRQTYDVFNTKTKCHEQRNETAWYVCNAKLAAEQAADFILNHWGIENVNHYVTDVALCEDDSRIRNNSGNMAILRSTALNILRKQKIENIKRRTLSEFPVLEAALHLFTFSLVLNSPEF